MTSIPLKALTEYVNDGIGVHTAPLQKADEEFPLYYAPGIDLYARRQRMNCMDTLLRNEIVRHHEKQYEFRQRWASAARTLHGIDHTIRLVNRPYMESRHEIERAVTMTGQQTDLFDQKRRHAISLLKEKVYLKDVKRSTLYRLDKFSLVRDYLTKVVEASHGEFTGIKQLIDRSDLLLETRNELVKRNDRLHRRIQRRENELNSISIVDENAGILLNNYIADVTDDLAQAKEVCHRLESDVAHVRDTAHRRTMVLGQLKIGTYNIYSQMCESFGRVQKVKSNDVIGQLENIKWTLCEINKIRSTLNEMLAREKAERERVAWMEQKHRRVWGRWQKGVRDLNIRQSRVVENRQRDAFGLGRVKTEVKLSMPSITKMVIKYLHPRSLIFSGGGQGQSQGQGHRAKS